MKPRPRQWSLYLTAAACLVCAVVAFVHGVPLLAAYVFGIVVLAFAIEWFRGRLWLPGAMSLERAVRIGSRHRPEFDAIDPRRPLVGVVVSGQRKGAFVLVVADRDEQWRYLLSPHEKSAWSKRREQQWRFLSEAQARRAVVYLPQGRRSNSIWHAYFRSWPGRYVGMDPRNW